MSRWTPLQLQLFLKENFAARTIPRGDNTSQLLRFQYSEMSFEIEARSLVHPLTFESIVGNIMLFRRLVETAPSFDRVKLKLLADIGKEEMAAMTCDNDLLQRLVVPLIDETLS